ncbi:MAG: SPASM domain-containing protein [Nitrospiraceae bacterium]|nr:SPASM domain-containing protein [Nitrospiraceae bacterium]
MDHEKVLKNINDFLNMRKKLRTNGPVIETIFYAMQGNDHEIEQFRDNWDGIVDHVRVVRKISRSFANFKLGGGSIPVRSKSCKHIWERMAIHWNGNIALCCEDVDGRHIFGNAADKSIKEIWNCNGLMALKKMHKENRIGDIPMCSQCDQ